jgi:hypothetical protein
LLERLPSYKDARATMSQAPTYGANAPVLPMHFNKGRTNLRLCTTIATLGTPQDITVQELRIESFFPMDSETRDVVSQEGGTSEKTRRASCRTT